jgi:hypothetical protein
LKKSHFKNPKNKKSKFFIFLINQDAMDAKIFSQRTSMAGSGQLTVRKFSQPIAFQSDG